MHSKDLMSRGANEIKNKTSKTTLYVHMEPNLTDHALPNTRHGPRIQICTGITDKKTSNPLSKIQN